MLAAIRKIFTANTRLPPDVQAQLESEGILHLSQRVSVIQRFSGSVPGLHSGGSISRTAGALAFTSERVLATMAVRTNSSQRVLDYRWDATPAGPLKVEISATGVRLDLDVASVDQRFSGHLWLHYKTTLPADLLAQLPRTSLALGITADVVSTTLGVRGR